MVSFVSKFIKFFIVDPESSLPKNLQIIGGSTFLTSLTTRLTNLIVDLNLNTVGQLITIFGVFVGSIYTIMKIYDQYLITKKRKKEDNG